jgi:formylglycine-generating enzyme required for sulfatase activity/flagellar basal body-associated protein FliL
MSAPLANPYVGPRPFTAAEAGRFFGREQEANQLLSLVLAERLALFYAQSGAGKSSLLQARLMPHLEQAGLIVLPLGRVSGDLPPGVSRVNNIFAFNLMLSLARSQGDPNRFSGVSLSHFLARLTSDDGHSYYYDAEALPTVVNPAEAAAYVLIIDQFEEIITTHPEHWPERADFFRQLDAAMADDPLLRVVLTLREDFVAGLDPYSSLLTGKLRARFYMQRMGQAAALEAIRRPAELGGRPFAPGVAESLVDNLRQLRSQTPLIPPSEGGLRGVFGQFVEPVQLQVVCYQLWENLKGRLADLPGTLREDLAGLNEITAADVDMLGNVDKALADFYEQALAKTLAQLTSPPTPLSSEERGPGGEVSELHLRRWFDQELITEAGTRGTVYQGAQETAGLPNAAVKLLADQFLLRAELRAGGMWYELVHDRFVEPIVQANQKWEAERLQRNPLAAPAAAWHNDPAKLLDGTQLAAAQAYAEANPLDITKEEREFLQESLRREAERQEQARQARRRNLFIGVALVVVAIVMAALAVWGFTSAERAVQKANEAATAQAEAETQKAAAQAAATQVARQNEQAQAELNFYQATDPPARLAELAKLLSQSNPDSQAKARQLFFSLPQVDQVPLLRVADEPLLPLARAVLPSLADVNRTGYTDEHLQALVETLPGLPETGALPARLEAWLAARQSARDKQYEAALAQYDELIKGSDDNPALFYERAGVLAALNEPQAALADLEQVLSLAHSPAYAATGTLPLGPEFANRDQMIKAVQRLMMVHPKLIDEFKNVTAKYASLTKAKLVFPTVITDTRGIPLVRVPAGPFKMGSNVYSNEQPVHQVDLDEFYIDQYEVTNAQYRRCEEAGDCKVPDCPSSYEAPDKADHPVVCVTWFQAKVYCEWREARLPSEAEWEKAARGTDQRTYPWGEEIDCNLANYGACGTNDTTLVGSYPAGVSPYGAYDMAGNVWEWVQSEYKDYPYHADDGREENLDSTDVLRVLRGGSWYYYGHYARASPRDSSNPYGQGDYIGFRCVAAAP